MISRVRYWFSRHPILDQIRIGRVVVPGPVVKFVMTTSSSEIVDRARLALGRGDGAPVTGAPLHFHVNRPFLAAYRTESSMMPTKTSMPMKPAVSTSSKTSAHSAMKRTSTSKATKSRA